MPFDIIIRGGTVIDGTESAKGFRADVGIRGDSIHEIGDLSRAEAARVIDATGKAVAPGFIDMHTHSDFSSLDTPTADSKVLCGVTTEVLGQCGGSPFPMRGEVLTRKLTAYEQGDVQIAWRDIDGYIAECERIGSSVNRAPMVGHNTIRGAVVGYAARPATREELREMVREVEFALKRGAFGLTTGLVYPPGCYAATEEVVELARPLAAAGAIYASHIRSEGDRLEASIDEVLEIHKKTGAKVHISHLKVAKRRNWKKIDWLRDRLFRAVEDGADVTADRYPYIASATGLDAVLPEWTYEGTVMNMLDRLRDDATRAKVRAEVEAMGYVAEEDWNAVMVSECEERANRRYQGRRMDDVAREMGLDPFDALCELLIADGGRTSAVYFHMKEEILEEILGWPFVMIGSDSSARNAEKARLRGKPHPRSYGTSARVLGRYVRERGALTLGQAVWKLAGFPAKRLGLGDRGVLAVGRKADIVVFDPAAIIDRATFEDPHQYAAGIETVLVNGALTVDGARHLGTLSGRVLRRS